MSTLMRSSPQLCRADVTPACSPASCAGYAIVVLVLLFLPPLACVPPALAELPPIDHPWPPDPGLYDPPGTVVAPGLAIGDMLDRANAGRAKGLLPPEILSHYETGAFRNPIVSWPPGIMYYEKEFSAATHRNLGRYDIDTGTGTIIDTTTGKPPAYIEGLPFPSIREGDPKAGLKALWNYFHVRWHQGSVHMRTLLLWMNARGVDRQSTQDITFQFYENQAPAYRLPNPHGYLSQFIGVTIDPADLQGTVAMSYRYRDPNKRDSVWTYVPALRRVRPVSPANRSDGFLGSDLSQDDSAFFDGKPEDFVWKTVGLRDGLRIVDPDSIRGSAPDLQWAPGGGWQDEWPDDRPAAGYLAPDWDGSAWAPVSAGLAKRRFWVIEGVPRDRYYLYGRLELWIDTDSWTGAFNRKFSWKGELLNTYAVTAWLNYPARREGSNSVDWLFASTHAWQCAENVKLHRATLTGIRAGSDASQTRLPLDVQHLFSLQSLSRMGK